MRNQCLELTWNHGTEKDPDFKAHLQLGRFGHPHTINPDGPVVRFTMAILSPRGLATSASSWTTYRRICTMDRLLPILPHMFNCKLLAFDRKATHMSDCQSEFNRRGLIHGARFERSITGIVELDVSGLSSHHIIYSAECRDPISDVELESSFSSRDYERLRDFISARSPATTWKLKASSSRKDHKRARCEAWLLPSTQTAIGWSSLTEKPRSLASARTTR